MVAARKEKGLHCGFWTDADAVMDWWIYGQSKKPLPLIEGQIDLFGDVDDAIF